mgnify:CR=1 FL=1
MERRIKILNGFTAIVIVLFATMQCNWLYSRYRYTLHEYQDTLYNRVLNVIETGNELRRASVNDSILVVPNMKLSVSNATHRFEFEIYTINTRLYDIKDSLTFANLARIYESEHPAGIEKHTSLLITVPLKAMYSTHLNVSAWTSVSHRDRTVQFLVAAQWHGD